MDSDKSDEDEHEAISKQIVDYYKKYSLSQQLPKYFSGTPLSYMPKIVKEEELNKPLIIVEDTNHQVLVEKQSEYCQTDVEEATELKAISPASSVASNRKLEWDSGADIGYNNCNKSKLHKSLSLPTLTVTPASSKVKEKAVKTKLSSHIVTVISYSGPSDEGKTIQSSSSSSSYPVEAPVASSSSSDPRPPSAKPLSSSSSSCVRPSSHKAPSSSSSSFATTLAYLKSKIGSPDAESTPKIFTENHPLGVKLSETPFVPKIHKKFHNKVVELCITKPISIECTDEKRIKALDKRVQTSFVEKLSKSVQTNGVDVEHSDSRKLIHAPKENQSVIIINYDNGSDKKTYSSNTQTESEFIPSPENVHEGNLKRMKTKYGTTDSSKEVPLLGQLISKKQSKSLVGDIDRSIELLQKLLRSKKYDPVTKKRYVKKIVEKIIDNKYNEDSTTSSELFLPRKPEDKVQQKLQENIPWYPPKISTFGVKTSSDEGHPEEAKKKSVYTVTNSPTSCVETSTSLEKQPNTSSGSFQSWKEDKTLSERLLEEKQKNGGGDQLVKFAMKERQNQLAWINDEISHLTKLKGLLEKKRVHTTTTVYMVSQQHDKKYCTKETCPNLNPNGERHQQINERVCTPETCPILSKTSGNAQDNGRPESLPHLVGDKEVRNYVIQTEISDSTSGEGIVNFDLYDQSGKRSYQVEQAMENRRNDVVGNIEVVSDDQTTNIKVKTGKVQRLEPKNSFVFGTEKYDTYPRSRQEEQRCWPCGIIQSRRGGDLIGSQKYCFNGSVSKKVEEIMKKVDEIVNKYGSKSSVDGCSKHSGEVKNILCPCQCSCKKITDQTLIVPSTLKSNKDAQFNVDSKCQTVTNLGSSNSSSISSTSRDRKKQTVDASIQCICFNNANAQTEENVRQNQKCGTEEGSDNKNVYSQVSTDEYRTRKQPKIIYNCADAGIQCNCLNNDKTQTKENVYGTEEQLNNNSADSKMPAEEYRTTRQRNIIRSCADANIQCICVNNNKTQTEETLHNDQKCGTEERSDNKNVCVSTDEYRTRRQRKIISHSADAVIQCNCLNNDETQTEEKKCICKFADANIQCTCMENSTTQTEEFKKEEGKGTIDPKSSIASSESRALKGGAKRRINPENSITTSEYKTLEAGGIGINNSENSMSSSQSKLLAGGAMEEINLENRTSTEEDSIKLGKKKVIDSEPEPSRKFLENRTDSSTQVTNSDSESSSASSIHSCTCCKKKNVTSRELSSLRKKLNENAVPLCRPCYFQNRRCAYSFATYSAPGYVCNCYTVVETRTLDAIKKTMTDLEECCSCVDADNRSKSSCCKYCKRKLKKTSRNRNGIAYMLTFENTSDEERKKKDKKLEEIKIKIPVKKKKLKDKENKRRKDSQDDGKNVVTVQELQEYLNVNRPDFLENAEKRRNLVKDSRSQREEESDRKKLMFLNNYRENKEKNSKRLFSEKEMKEITKRNYRKLPEVQRKLMDNREKQIRQANRLIADTFNRKLREKVLKGRRTLPTNVNVVSL